MRVRFLTGTVVFLIAWVLSLAQNGALGGYYPRNFNGRAFTGRVTATDRSTHTITLMADSRRNPVTFTGKFEQNCEAPGRAELLWDPSDLPPGTYLTAYYTEKKNQSGSENLVVGLMLHENQGIPIADSRK